MSIPTTCPVCGEPCQPGQHTYCPGPDDAYDEYAIYEAEANGTIDQLYDQLSEGPPEDYYAKRLADMKREHRDLLNTED